MSSQFGKINFDGKLVDPKDLERVRPVLAPYGPDGEGYICKDHFGLLYRAFYTTEESRREIPPHVLRCGAFLMWDGRLDNREELIGLLGDSLSQSSTDLSTVAMAFEQWRTDAFGKLIGDWALSICDPACHSVILAKDFIGTRQLYYTVEKDEVMWCTILDPLVVFSGRQYRLDEEYIAGWLGGLPAPHLTPYVGIHSVPPSSFILLKPGECSADKYWDFSPNKIIRYQRDSDYEEEFRSVLSRAVQRRLRSDAPVLAELSGGVDSSSIVCVADTVVGKGPDNAPRVETISYYNDAEPHWDERPYFTKVEVWRGLVGRHIAVSAQDAFGFEMEDEGFVTTPAHGGGQTWAAEEFSNHLISRQYRVLLSGTGGDEISGGVPTPIPELADLLVDWRLRELLRQLQAWSLAKRKPWIQLLSATFGYFFPPGIFGYSGHEKYAPWVSRKFVGRYPAYFGKQEERVKMLGPRPSFQENLRSIEVIRRQLACSVPPTTPPIEKRFPYLDRDLIEYMFAIPREQIVRPGQRRSLTRRALLGIVPDDVLNRRTKAFVARGPMLALLAARPQLIEMARNMISSSLGFIDANAFLRVLGSAPDLQGTSVSTILRTLALESWLRSFAASPFCSQSYPRIAQMPRKRERTGERFEGELRSAHGAHTASPAT